MEGSGVDQIGLRDDTVSGCKNSIDRIRDEWNFTLTQSCSKWRRLPSTAATIISVGISSDTVAHGLMGYICKQYRYDIACLTEYCLYHTIAFCRTCYWCLHGQNVLFPGFLLHSFLHGGTSSTTVISTNTLPHQVHHVNYIKLLSRLSSAQVQRLS